MKYNRELFIEGIDDMNLTFTNHPLPKWDDLPELELYMDQIIVVLGQYLKFYQSGDGDENFITASMINNYVKLKIMPAPIKKKYNRVHLAYLIIICTLKQTLSMSTIQKIIPFDLTIEEVISIYNNFSFNQQKVLLFINSQVDEIARPIADQSAVNPQRIHDLVLQLAMLSNITKYLTDRIVKLQIDEKVGDK